MKILGLDDELTFGKHTGKQVEDVVEDDPGYIRWIAENSTTHGFDEAVLEALEKREQRRV